MERRILDPDTNQLHASFLIAVSLKCVILSNKILLSKAAFTGCRHIMKTVKEVTVAKFELAFTRYRHNLKTVGNFIVKSRCRTLMQKKSTYTVKIDQSRSKSVEKCSVYIIVECSHDVVSNLCRLGFLLQNLPFSKSAGKNVPFSCEREAYPSHFAPFSKCAGIV